MHFLLVPGKKWIPEYETTQLDTRMIARRNETAYLCRVDGICQRFALVERLEESIESLGPFNNSPTMFDEGMKAYIILAALRSRLWAYSTCIVFACGSFLSLRCYYSYFLCRWV